MTAPNFGFTLLATDGAARRGQIVTAHGTIETPAFMPVGTAATVKGLLPQAVAETGAEILLGNTYHLMLRPGAERVESLGGLHRFMHWDKPILTDSGGFQVMSLAGLREMSERGVTFRSHLDGSKFELTPERSIDIQRCLDADITMVLDECPPYPSSREQIETSLALTTRWAARSKAAFTRRPGYGIFGIVQGGVHPDLRRLSAESLIDIGFDGYALGGLAVGEGQELMFQVLENAVPHLPGDKPRYLMGVGTPADLVGGVARGVDMFDCVMPTRSGRTAQGFTRRGKVNLRNARHQDDPRPLDADCRCPACANHSRAYLHHLFRCEEMLGPILLSWHNLTYYQDLMREMRDAIAAGSFDDFQAGFHEQQALADIPALG